MSTTTPITQSKRKRRTRGQEAREREEKRQKIADTVEGQDLIGACFDKRFIGYGTWTATIDEFNSSTKLYTCRYVDGYTEHHTRQALRKYGLFRPKDGEVVEANTNPDEHPALYVPRSQGGTGLSNSNSDSTPVAPVTTSNDTATSSSSTTTTTTSASSSSSGTTATTTTNNNNNNNSNSDSIPTASLANAQRNNEILLSDSDDEKNDENGDDVVILSSTSNNNNNNSGVVVDLTSDNDDDGATARTAATTTTTTTTTTTSAKKRKATSKPKARKKGKGSTAVDKDDLVDVKPEPVAFGMADIPPDVIELSEADFYGPEEWAKMQYAKTGLNSASNSKVSSKKSKSKNNNNNDDDDDIVFISSTDNTSSYELPHARKDCPVHKYQPHFRTQHFETVDRDTPAQKKKRRLQNMKCCDKCYCMICETPAKECKWWSIATKPHCIAVLKGFDSNYWKEQKVVLSNIFLRTQGTLSANAKSDMRETISSVKRIFDKYHKGQEVYEYDDDSDDDYGFFGFLRGRSRRFDHVSHDFDNVVYTCEEYIRKIENSFRNYHMSETQSTIVHGIAILDAMTEQIGRQTWSPLQNEVSCSDDKWDKNAEKKYEKLVLKLGKQWFRIIKPDFYKTESEKKKSSTSSAIAKVPVGKCLLSTSNLSVRLNMMPPHCKHAVSKLGLNIHFRNRTSSKLKCAHPSCKIQYTKYQYKDVTPNSGEQMRARQMAYVAGKTEIVVKQELLDRLKLRLKDLLNVTKTASMRDMIQALLFDTSALDVIKRGEFAPYRAPGNSSVIPEFYTSIALEQGRVQFAIQQILASRKSSMSLIFSNFSCMTKFRRYWDFVTAGCLARELSVKDTGHIKRALQRRSPSVPPATLEVAEYLMGLRLFFGKMTERHDKANAANTINLINDGGTRGSGSSNSSNSSSNDNNDNNSNGKGQAMELSATFKQKRLGLEIYAGPFGRVYVTKKTEGFTSNEPSDHDARGKIKPGDLLISVNGKYLSTIDANVHIGKMQEHNAKLLAATNVIRSLEAPLSIVCERPFYSTTISGDLNAYAGDSSHRVFAGHVFQHFKSSNSTGLMPSYDQVIAAETKIESILAQGSNACIVQLCTFTQVEFALRDLKLWNYAEKCEMLAASAALSIMTSSCTKALAVRLAGSIDFKFRQTQYYSNRPQTSRSHRFYRFLYWCCKFHSKATTFGKHFLKILVFKHSCIGDLFDINSENKCLNGSAKMGFDINLTQKRLKKERTMIRKAFCLEKFDIDMVKILFASSETLQEKVYTSLLLQIRNYDAYLARSKKPSVLVGDMRKTIVTGVLNKLKPIALSQSVYELKRFTETWKVLPTSLQNDPELNFLHICVLFMKELRSRGPGKEKQHSCNPSAGCHHNLKNAWSNLWDRFSKASAISIQVKKQRLDEMLIKLFKKLDDRNYMSKISENLTFKCLICQYNKDAFEIYMKNLFIAKDKYGIEIEHFIRSLLVFPKQVKLIPGYPVSNVKTIKLSALLGNQQMYECNSYFEYNKNHIATRNKLNFIASVLKNENNIFSDAQQQVIFKEFLPFIKFFMKDKRIKLVLDSIWKVLVEARKRKTAWLNKIGTNIYKHIVKMKEKQLSSKLVKRLCLPTFKALKDHRKNERKRKGIYQVKVQMQRDTSSNPAYLYKMNLSLAEIRCKTIDPKTKTNFFVLAVEKKMPGFALKSQAYKFDPSYSSTIFSPGVNRSVKMGDVLYKINAKVVIGKSMAEVLKILKAEILKKRYDMYGGFPCTFVRKFEDKSEFFDCQK